MRYLKRITSELLLSVNKLVLISVFVYFEYQRFNDTVINYQFITIIDKFTRVIHCDVHIYTFGFLNFAESSTNTFVGDSVKLSKGISGKYSFPL